MNKGEQDFPKKTYAELVKGMDSQRRKAMSLPPKIENETFSFGSHKFVPKKSGVREQFFKNSLISTNNSMDVSFSKPHRQKTNSYKKFFSAGILPFSIKNDKIYFLLGKDSNEEKWSDFGGRSEEKDQGRWEMTAAREFYEETIGSVLDIPNILAKLQKNKDFSKSAIKIKGKTYAGSPYIMFLVKIPYKESYRNQFHSTLALLKYARKNSSGKFLDYKYFEKNDIQWVSLDTLKTALESTDKEEIVNYPLRAVFQDSLEGHLDRIIEFCNKKNKTHYHA